MENQTKIFWSARETRTMDFFGLYTFETGFDHTFKRTEDELTKIAEKINSFELASDFLNYSLTTPPHMGDNLLKFPRADTDSFL